MPRIKRWFPVSHNFNRDPEVRELRRLYADWMALVWAEMCSISDQNEGEILGKPEQIADSLSYISMRNRPSLASKLIQNSFTFMAEHGWIRVETDRILVLNYGKYHIVREPKETPPGNRIASLPSEPSEPSLTNNPPNPQPNPKKKPLDLPAELLNGFDEFWDLYPKKVDKREAAELWAKVGINGTRELILTALRQHKQSEQWLELGGKYIPSPARWLRKRKWEDELKPALALVGNTPRRSPRV